MQISGNLISKGNANKLLYCIVLYRILQKHDIQVVNKPFKSLKEEFPSPKFTSSIEHQPNVI